MDELPSLAFDHEAIVLAGRERLRAKLSYTNVGFALAPAEFTISELRDLYAAALGHDVSATNLQRVLVRRGVLELDGKDEGTRAARGADPAHSSASGHRHWRSPTSSRCFDLLELRASRPRSSPP